MADALASPSPRAAEESASLPSRLVFAYLTPLFRLGRQRPIAAADVPPLLQTLHGERCYEALERHFKDTVDAGAPSLAAAAWRANRHGWWRAGLAFGLMWALFVVQPLQLRLLVSDLEGSHELTAAQLWLTACGLLVSGLLQTLMFNWHQIFIARRKMAIRSALCVAVFRKSLRLSPRGRGRGGASTGRIVNLMSTDAEQSAAMFEAVNMLWTFPLAIGVGLWLMYEQVGDALLFGLGFLLLLMLPPQLLVFGKMAGLHAEMLGIADERVKLVGEYLAGMRVVKLSAWEPRVAAQISAVFAREAAVLYRLAMWLSAGGLTLLLAAPLLVPVVIFIAYVELGNELTASRAFTTLALYGVVRWPFGLWGGAMQAVVSAFVSLRRLQAYLLLPELPSEPVAEPADPALAVEVRGATFAWEAATEEEEEEEEEAAAGAAGAAEAEKQQQGVELVKQKAPPFALRDLELRVPKGALVAVVGRVGAGKSTLLAGLLGETRCDRSRVAIRGRVGYCAQHAWVMNDSLIGNVLMGQPLDRQRFDRVIEATALAPDLKQLPNGEQTEIGERGINLSGGQKHRVALARALYSDADVFLLDDVLSAVDPKVAEHIFSEALCRMLRERGKTVIMATNHVHLLPRFDHVVMLDAGRVVEQGSLRELVARGSDIEGLVRSAVTGSSALDAAAAAAVATAASAGDDEQKKPDRASKRGGAGARERERDDGKLVVEEDRATGAVPMQSYLVYAAAFGWGLVVVRLAVEALELGARTGTDFWLADWSTRRDLTSRENTVAVLVYTAWSLASVALVVGGSVLFAVGAVRAVRNLHAQLLTGVLAAPMSFFESTPVGRILNRFSRDLDKVATELPISLSNAVGASFEVVFTLIALAVATKGIFSPLIVPFSFLFYHVQASYRATARELQRLDSIARSPVFAHFSETLAGIGTIRAFEQSARFARQNEFLVNEHARISYTVIAGSSWLTVRLDSISAFVSFSVAVIIVAVDDLLPAGWAGLALAYSFNLAFNLMFATQNFAAVENSMTSVQRIGHYCREIESERAIVAPEPAKIPEDWPREGALEVRDLWLSYRTGGPVLKGLNLRIAPGQRVGLVGRTGSGKSSLLLAILRVVEAASGSILIDGVDVASVELARLRRAVSIIPQDALLFTGSLRSNLDPFGEYSDEQLWEATRKAQLEPAVRAAGGLDCAVEENGRNFSAGQRQLICIARAILRRARLVLIDEATASIDSESDRLVQKMLREQLAHATVITVAHRLATVMDSDLLAVLDAGRLAALDSPAKLLADSPALSAMLESADAAPQSQR